MTFHWNERAVGTLTKMAADGCSAAEIGRAIGASRNAVIGKIHRLKGVSLKGRTGKNAIVSAPRRATVRKPKPVAPVRKAPAAEYVAAVIIYRGAVSILDVGEFECRWPVGGEKAGMLCCGKPIDPDCVRKFCPEHFILSCGEGTASERAAAPASHFNPMKRRAA